MSTNDDMIYKDYAADIHYSSEDNCLIGHIAGIQDIVGFHGDSVEEIKQAFHEAVDDYLDIWAERGKEPPKPFSGELMLRIAPELHARLASKASSQGKSLNGLVAETLERSVF
jgi:predicted HicB family RNase H-like nuclease